MKIKLIMIYDYQCTIWKDIMYATKYRHFFYLFDIK